MGHVYHAKGYWSRGRAIGAEAGLLERGLGYWSRGRAIGAEAGLLEQRSSNRGLLLEP
jgi:hypothetical protein